jgi:zinc protease
MIEGALGEVRLMRDTLVDPEELADVKNFIVGSLPLHLETNEGVAGTILELERYNLGLDYLARYPELVHAVTAEQVRAAAARWMDPDNVAISVAGPAARETVGTEEGAWGSV